MLNLERNRNILDDLLSGNCYTGINSDVERLTTVLNSVVTPPSPRKHRSSKKKQATHYLDHEVFVALGQLKEQLRHNVSRHSLISKSSIVNALLHLLLNECSAKKNNSPLLKRIMKYLHQSQASPPTK